MPWVCGDLYLLKWAGGQCCYGPLVNMAWTWKWWIGAICWRRTCESCSELSHLRLLHLFILSCVIGNLLLWGLGCVIFFVCFRVLWCVCLLLFWFAVFALFAFQVSNLFFRVALGAATCSAVVEIEYWLPLYRHEERSKEAKKELVTNIYPMSLSALFIPPCLSCALSLT